jgi:hypothetical protein
LKKSFKEIFAGWLHYPVSCPVFSSVRTFPTCRIFIEPNARLLAGQSAAAANAATTTTAITAESPVNLPRLGDQVEIDGAAQQDQAREGEKGESIEGQ